MKIETHNPEHWNYQIQINKLNELLNIKQKQTKRKNRSGKK